MPQLTELREAMTEKDVEIILQRAREKFPQATPRIIFDNGPQFIAKNFKAFIRMAGMTHVRTSPYYPQSNGKLERWHKTIKHECIRPKVTLSVEEARVQITDYIRYYNDERLHSSLGYVAPKVKLEGREKLIFTERDSKLEAVREARKQKTAAGKTSPRPTPKSPGMGNFQPTNSTGLILRFRLKQNRGALETLSSLHISQVVPLAVEHTANLLRRCKIRTFLLSLSTIHISDTLATFGKDISHSGTIAA